MARIRSISLRQDLADTGHIGFGIDYRRGVALVYDGRKHVFRDDAVGSRDVVTDELDSAHHSFPYLRRGKMELEPEGRLGRDDVVVDTGLHTANCQHADLNRIDHSRHDRLELHDSHSSHDHGIRGVVRRRTMAT